MKNITLRCSSLPTLMVCPASVLNPDGLPRVEVYGEAAEFGTAMHGFCQELVETGEFNLTPVIDRHPTEAGRAKKIADNFLTVWNMARLRITKPVCELAHSTVLAESPEHLVTLTGHIDVCQIDIGGAFILDYKTGRSHENHYHQLAGYAFILWDYAGKPDVFSVNIAVVYLEDNTTQSYLLKASDLKSWKTSVMEKALAPSYVVSRKCGYCNIASQCKPHAEDVAYTLSFLESEDAHSRRVGWKSMTPEERGKLIDRMYVVERGIQKVKSSLKAAMLGDVAHRPVNRLDIGNGMVYERVTVKGHTVVSDKAWDVLKGRFDEKIVRDISELPLGAILSLVASYAPMGKKIKAKADMLERLVERGAVLVEQSERFLRRPADESQLTPE
jgi:hypothetical protein